MICYYRKKTTITSAQAKSNWELYIREDADIRHWNIWRRSKTREMHIQYFICVIHG